MGDEYTHYAGLEYHYFRMHPTYFSWPEAFLMKESHSRVTGFWAWIIGYPTKVDPTYHLYVDLGQYLTNAPVTEQRIAAEYVLDVI